MNEGKKGKLKHYVFLHVVLFFYAAMSIISKVAAPYDMLSWQFIVLYGVKMFALFVYAILWQQVLKHFDLTTAFANKAIAVVWGLVLGVLFFEETLTWPKVIGSLVIMAGIVIAVKEDGGEEHE